MKTLANIFKKSQKGLPKNTGSMMKESMKKSAKVSKAAKIYKEKKKKFYTYAGS